MVMGYADPFETLFAFQRALENRLSSEWLGTSTAAMGTYPPVNVFQQGDDLVAIVELPGINKEDRRSEDDQLSRECEPAPARAPVWCLRPHPCRAHANRSRPNKSRI